MKIFGLLDIQYNNFTNAVKSYLAKELSTHSTAYGNNTIFGQIINIVSSAIQNILLYIEDSLTEQNKYTAQRKKSIYGLAALSGYNPSYGKAAGIQLKLTHKPNNSVYKSVIINNKEQLICTQNGLTYNIILPQESIIMNANKNNTGRNVYAIQGKFETQTFVVTGGKYYTQNFRFLGNLDKDYIEVKVNNEVWDQCAGFYDMVSDGKQYVVKTSLVSGLDLVFGNDVHGRALNDKDVITVTYLIHDGELGNIDINTETYFIFNNMLTDTNGDEIDGNANLNVIPATLDAVTSGSNSESVEQVREMIGMNSRSLVLTSPEHYKELISKFSFCGYNRTWVEKGSLVINSLIMKNYKLLLSSPDKYFNLKTNDFVLSDSQKSSIINYIENSGRQLAGATYNIVDPEICKYAMFIYVKLKSNESEREYIANNIRSLVGSFFGDIKSDIFIPKSDIVQLLKNNIPEIDGVNIYILSERNETAIKNKQYVKTIYKFNYGLNTYDKYQEKIYLYEGENPGLGLDSHGNIYLESDEQFPVLMGGWSYVNKEGQSIQIGSDPLNIIFT